MDKAHHCAQTHRLEYNPCKAVLAEVDINLCRESWWHLPDLAWMASNKDGPS